MSAREFALALFGFSETERRVMTSVLRLAAGRGRRFVLTASDRRNHADIAIVDMDQPRAAREWRRCSDRTGGMPALWVASSPPEADAEQIRIRRPITVKRLLDGLDAVAIRSYRYVPELTIQDNHDQERLSGTAFVQADLAARSTRRTGARALVVDDSQPVRKLMAIKLGLFGIQVDSAESGEDALRMVEEQRYDVAFLDLTLPGIDGYSVCKTIKRTAGLRALPVVLLTGRGSRIDRIRGTMAGCSAYLTKPVEQDALHGVLQQLLPEENEHVY